MAHQCVRCSKMYPDGANELLTGCICGGKFFFFVRKEALEQAQAVTANLTREEKQQIEEDVLDIIGLEEADKPVILDLESIRVLTPGKYELDLVELFKGKPLVYRVEDGKYIIDLASSFRKDEK